MCESCRNEEHFEPFLLTRGQVGTADFASATYHLDWRDRRGVRALLAQWRALNPGFEVHAYHVPSCMDVETGAEMPAGLVWGF